MAVFDSWRHLVAEITVFVVQQPVPRSFYLLYGRWILLEALPVDLMRVEAEMLVEKVDPSEML